MAPTTSSSNLAQRAAASRADVGDSCIGHSVGVGDDSSDELPGRSAPTLAETLQSTHIRWRLHAGWAHRLATTDDKFGLWLADGRATLVKHGTNRLVYRVDGGDERLYIKRYRHRRGLARLAPLVRGSPARREWNKALELSRRGIPTALPVALGEDIRVGIPSDSLLVTREIPTSQSLDQFLQDELPRWTAVHQRAARRWLVLALAQLVAATHRAGVRHDDLHAGNILVNLDAARRLETTSRASTEDAAPSLFLIDLPGVSFGRPLGHRASLASVVMLAAGLLSHSTSREQWRFWRAYLACRPDLSIENPRQAARSIVSAVLDYQRALARSRDRRALATNRDFQRIETGSAVCYAVQELSPDVLQNALRSIEAGEGEVGADVAIATRAPGATAGLPSSATFDARLSGRLALAPNPDSKTASFERQLVAHRVPAARWPWAWLEHPARRRWRLAQALASRGILIEGPLAALVPRWFAPWRDGYLLFAPAAPATPLPEVLASLEHGDSRAARRLAETCGAALGQMHRWQVKCPALSIASFAVRRKSDEFAVLLADWTRSRRPRWSTPRQAQRRAMRDLAALRSELTSISESGRGATAGLPSSAASDPALPGEVAAATAVGQSGPCQPPPMSRTWLARALRAYVAVQLCEPTAWRQLWRQLAAE